jgi:hypothetical protein
MSRSGLWQCKCKQVRETRAQLGREAKAKPDVSCAGAGPGAVL